MEGFRGTSYSKHVEQTILLTVEPTETSQLVVNGVIASRLHVNDLRHLEFYK